MKNSEKNSRKSNFLSYLTFFSLTLLLTFGGIYFYYTAEDRRLAQQITLIKETNAQYEEKSNDAIVSINERNIQDKKYIDKKLTHDVNLKPEVRKKFKELLKEITIDQNIDQEILETKTKEERKEITCKVLTTQLKLSKFKSIVKEARGEKFDEINYLKKQNEWLEKFYPESGRSEEEEEVSEKLNIFLKYFWKEFMIKINLSFPKIAQLVKDEKGKYYPTHEPSSAVIKQEIALLKNRNPGQNFDKEMIVNFLGFKGWINEENGEKGTTTAGLTTHNGNRLELNEPRFKIHTDRNIQITLHEGFPISRKGKEYNLWLIETDGKISNIFVDWNNLIETIAHELAHAVINSTKVYYRGAEKKEEDGQVREEGGHGTLHREYTKELHEMIKNDQVEYPSFKKFWFKK